VPSSPSNDMCWIIHVAGNETKYWKNLHTVSLSLSTGNALWAHSCTIHSYKSWDACHVRKISICGIWKVSPRFLSRTTCSTCGIIGFAKEFHSECILSQMSWTVLSQEYETGEYWWCLLWNYLSAFVFDDSSGMFCVFVCIVPCCVVIVLLYDCFGSWWFYNRHQLTGWLIGSGPIYYY
jgi:hypothetical protein